MNSFWGSLQLGGLVFIGGGAGSLLRWGLGRIASHYSWSASFPWNTFAINVSGSFILGVVAGWAQDRPGWLALLGVGLCGGYTTFSTFSVEIVRLLEEDRLAAALLYGFGSCLLAILGAWLGLRLTRG